ncbi:MAG: hypothetical protein Ct9H300mP4_04250 [Gammaproteobacteria bacterium]|nr:MAG: hypothetical protein Ct9H300mP4_04250 [Gammaproteobacteria bacterium]
MAFIGSDLSGFLRSRLLIELEFGYKATLLGGRFRLNLTYFTMDWEDYQIELVDPSNFLAVLRSFSCSAMGQPWQKVGFQLGDAGSDGLVMEVLAFGPKDSTEVGFNAQWVTAGTSSPLADGVRLQVLDYPSPEFKGNLWLKKVSQKALWVPTSLSSEHPLPILGTV